MVFYVEGSQGPKGEKSRASKFAGQRAGRHVGALTPTHDALFATTLTGTAPTSLLLIGSALAGVGLIVRRQLRRTGRLSRT